MDLDKIKEQLGAALICDALDSMGYRHQSPRVQFHPYTGIHKMAGYCKTTLWADMYHEDPHPYDLELKAVDSGTPGSVFIAAAAGSTRSAIWGELLSTAAANQGCVGTIVHGAVRDIAKMREMGFPVFATSKNTYDSLHRQRVIDMDIPVEIDGVVFSPGDFVFCDEDGIVVVPRAIEQEVIEKALKKASAESVTRNEIKNGMKAEEAYIKYGVL